MIRADFFLKAKTFDRGEHSTNNLPICQCFFPFKKSRRWLTAHPLTLRDSVKKKKTDQKILFYSRGGIVDPRPLKRQKKSKMAAQPPSSLRKRRIQRLWTELAHLSVYCARVFFFSSADEIFIRFLRLVYFLRNIMQMEHKYFYFFFRGRGGGGFYSCRHAASPGRCRTDRMKLIIKK